MSTFTLFNGMLLGLSLSVMVQAQDFTHFVRQVQFPTLVDYDLPVPDTGVRDSVLPIDPGGARFELWTISANPLTFYLLDSTYVGAYRPAADIVVITEDVRAPNLTARTRANRPFQVQMAISGLYPQDDAEAPDAAKSVQLTRHVQSYGEKGNSSNIDPDQATLLSMVSLAENGRFMLNYGLTSVPPLGDDLSKARGEERFSIYSLEDNQDPTSRIPASLIAAATVQIWPVADGKISGINSGETLRYELPQLTMTMNDLYPDSTTYIHAYRGQAILGTEGEVISGSKLIVNEAEAVDRTLVVKAENYDSVLAEDGVWTIELMTVTPFGIDRLDYVTFTLDRTMKVRGAFHTIE